jgi:hypothetical protein
VSHTTQRMVSDTVAFAVGAPALVPVIVSVNVLRWALPGALIVSVELVPVTVEGLNVPTTARGSPLSDRDTAPERPAVRVTVSVYARLFACGTVREAGVAERENDPAGVTTSVTGVLCDSLLLVPVTVSG